jgi:hypothetical protein
MRATAGVPRSWVYDQEEMSTMLQASFAVLSFGYMLPWTSLGSLISYYKSTYGAGLYVRLYCGFYLPGLPVSLLQYYFDPMLDDAVGSRTAYLWRGLLAYFLLAMIMIGMLFVNDDQQNVLVFMFVLLGICSWLLHGSASMLAAMFPKAVIAYLQIGFRCPELYAMAMDYSLSIGSTASHISLEIFYIATAAFVLVALGVWVIVVTSSSAHMYFDNKDFKASGSASEAAYVFQKNPADQSGIFAFGSNVANYSSKGDGERQYYYGEEDWLLVQPAAQITDNSSGDSVPFTLNKPSSIENAKQMLFMISNFTDDSGIFETIKPLAVALLIVMWCSIFQAAFFAYVSSPDGRNIGQILYFLRLVCDLLGRPLTFLPRPWFLKVCH